MAKATHSEILEKIRSMPSINVEHWLLQMVHTLETEIEEIKDQYNINPQTITIREHLGLSNE